MYPNRERCFKAAVSEGVSHRPFGRAALGLFAFAVATGCGIGSPLDFLGGYIPSEEELQAYAEAEAAFDELVGSLPLMTVRITNDTSATARVDLNSRFGGRPVFPEPEEFEGIMDMGVAEDWLEEIDFQTVYVAAGGTVTGELQCGEVIGVAVTAPSEPSGFSVDATAFELPRYGYSLSNGNVALSGIGAEAGQVFTGDTVAGARFVSPETEGIDCETATLVIRIETTATRTVYDTETGQLIVGGSSGTGTLSVE